MILRNLLLKALDVKGMECSHDTALDYKSYIKNFTDYLFHIEQPDILVEQFRRRHALEYSDYLLGVKNHAHITRNNNIRGMKSLFYILMDREYVEVNHFAKIKKLREAQKRRKVYDETESKIIIDYIQEHKPNLLTAIFFCYYCALRRKEMLRLRIGDIDLRNGFILMSGDQTKNGRLGSIVIPYELLNYLKSIRINKYPQSHFVFSHKLAPGPIGCGINNIPRNYRNIIHHLHKENVLHDIEGKTFYSWKDTAARDMIRAGLTVPEIQKHFRHQDIGTTQRYLESFGVENNNVREFRSGFMVA